MVQHLTPQSHLFTKNYAGGFRPTEFEEAPRQRGVITSEAAAEAVQPRLRGQLEQVLSAYRAVGQHGLTDEEAESHTGISGNSLRPRRRALENAGLIARTDRTRPTRSGARAIVFVAVSEVLR